MKILALDLGTQTGYALKERSGVEDFTPSHRDSKGMRYIKFEAWLIDVLEKEIPGLVAYEMPHYRGGAATAVLVTMEGIVQKECDKRNIDYTAVHSGTLKKFATGRGTANKEDMIKGAQMNFGKNHLSSDEADALWLLEWAKYNYARE